MSCSRPSWRSRSESRPPIWAYPRREERLLSCVDFIEMTATSFLREAFRADLVGIWHVDLSGTGSYCLADSPAPPEGFHDYAVGHPLVGELRRTGGTQPYPRC